MLYTYPYWWSAVGGAQEPAFAEYPLWMADYTPPLNVPKPWMKAAIWQKGGGKTLKLPGGVPVDEDEISDEDTLSALMVKP